MYKILTVKDEVRVPPINFDLDLNEALKQSLQDSVEGTMNPDVGVFLAITEVTTIGEGKIVPEDGAVFYPAEFKVLTYKPEINEIVLGEVVDITEFGAFIRIGPIDALTHVSQIMDDKIASPNTSSRTAAFTKIFPSCVLSFPNSSKIVTAAAILVALSVAPIIIATIQSIPNKTEIPYPSPSGTITPAVPIIAA